MRGNDESLSDRAGTDEPVIGEPVADVWIDVPLPPIMLPEPIGLVGVEIGGARINMDLSDANRS
jgi:hypothetical protein